MRAEIERRELLSMMVVVFRDYVACWALALRKLSTVLSTDLVFREVAIGTGMRGKSQIFDLILSRNKQAQALYNDDPRLS